MAPPRESKCRARLILEARLSFFALLVGATGAIVTKNSDSLFWLSLLFLVLFAVGGVFSIRADRQWSVCSHPITAADRRLSFGFSIAYCVLVVGGLLVAAVVGQTVESWMLCLIISVVLLVKLLRIKRDERGANGGQS